MSTKSRLKALSAAMAVLMALGTLSGCNGGSGSSSGDDSGSSDVSTTVPGNGSGITVTSEFTLEGTKEITDTVGAVKGSDAVYTYKYKLEPGDFCLVRDNRPACKIVISANAGGNIQAAANDLTANIKLMTGAEIPIVDDSEETDGNIILVGASSKTEELGVNIQKGFPKNEGFRVISSANVLVLAGNDEGDFTGTQYAVTYFLKSIGFGWYGDGSLWTVIPSASNVYAAECDIESTPSFASRYTRVNNDAPDVAKRWYMGGYKSEVEHKFGYLFPVDRYYSSHPEYYALSKGTRSTEGKRWWQLCLSNKDVQNITAEKCIEYFEENPSYVGVSIGQNDGDGNPNSSDYANWCECDECRKFAGSFTETMMKFSNIVGDKIKSKCPGKTVMFYAYFPTFDAPATNLKASDNVLLMLCKQGGLTRFIRNNNLFNGYMGNTQFSANFEAWKNLGYKHIAIYEWNCPGAANEAWKDAFWVQGEVFLDNARWFKSKGVEFIKIDQGPNPSYERAVDYWDLRWPLWYVNSIGMYNSELTFEEIMRPACDNLFGEAGELMYRFYKKLNDANKNCDTVNTTWGLPSVGEVYTRDYVIEIDSVISDALKVAAKVGGDVQARVENQYENWKKTKSLT